MRMFDEANLELDSYWLGTNLSYVARVNEAGVFRGEVVGQRGGRETFGLRVEPESQQTSVTIDLSRLGTPEPTFTVGVGGYVLFAAPSTDVRRYVAIPSGERKIADNQKPIAGDRFVFQLLRPGAHTLSDVGGAACTVAVKYPDHRMPTEAVVLTIHSDRKGATRFEPDQIEISPLQPVVIIATAGAHIESRLSSLTDREDGQIVTRRHRAR
jgi:hypothetical protein